MRCYGACQQGKLAGMQRRMHRPGRFFPGVLALAVVAALGVPTAAAATTTSSGWRAGARLSSTVYRNPVSRTVGDTYADPDVVRGTDGWWYAYATSDPLHSGETTPHYIPMSKSRDLVHWRYAGDAFSAATLPRWADTANGAALWAPDVHYAGGQWRMYYVVTQTTVTPDRDDNAIGMATAPSPLGPWTDSGAPVIPPRPGRSGNPDDFLWTFDPSA